MPPIPYDMYESDEDILIIIPFWWVEKESISISIQYETITITGDRKKTKLWRNYKTLQEPCYRWPVSLHIDLPPEVRYKEMESKLSIENILTILIPKNIIPDNIPLHIEKEKIKKDKNK